jgi:hypothetical protein
VDLRAANDSVRATAGRVLLTVAYEHGVAVHLLARAGLFTSAFGVSRLQFEALVRAVWALCAATEGDLGRLTGELSEDSIARLPMVSEMLKRLVGKSPDGVLETFEDFRTKALKPLNSYVHAGEHAYHLTRLGYPEQLVRRILVASNGLLWLTVFQIAAVADDASAAVRLYGTRTEYADCLPERESPSNKRIERTP